MPHIFVRNDTQEVLNVAIWFTAPVAFNNSLAPGATWGPHDMASFAYPSFEARIDHGPVNQYSLEASLAAAGTIAGACAAGTASVLVGTTSALGAWGGGLFGMAKAVSGFGAASSLMNTAHAGGAAYANEAEGKVLTRGPILIGFVEKHYAVRFINGQYELFDEDENRVL